MAKNESSVDLSKILNYQYPDRNVEYNRRDVILYGLGIGAKELNYVYENDPNFATIPTYATALVMKGTNIDVFPFAPTGSLPGLKFNPAMLLHGEQTVEILNNLPTSGNFVHKSKIIGFYDKGKGAVLVTEGLLVDPKSSKTYVRLTSSSFIRGLGGFGGDKGPSGDVNIPPKRTPDVIHEDPTSTDQAKIYRLSGDYNPLHIDPKVSGSVGFEKPILHGLCTFGFAARAVLKHFCNNNTQYFKSIAVRFSSPVYPGETLVTEMWRTGNDVLFQVRVKERNVIVISNAKVVVNTPQNKM